MKSDTLRYSIFSVVDHYPDQSRTGPELYAEVSRQCLLAEELGYEGFFVAEHHFAPYGIVPNPAVFLASLATRTSSIKLGPAVSVLTFHHGFEVAENYAMLDILSGGRVVLGVGSGYLAHELSAYKVNVESKRERYDEALAVLEAALTGEPFSFHGKYNSIENMQLNVKPVQPGGIPIYVAVSAPNVAYYVGRQGRGMMFVPYSQLESFEEIGQVVQYYRDGLKEGQVAPGFRRSVATGDIIMALHAHVGETDEAARAVAKAPFELYLRTRQRARHQTFEKIAGEAGLSLVGSPRTVAEKLVRLHEVGVRHIALLHNFGAMPAEEAERSMRLFMDEVVPIFNALLNERAEVVGG